MNNQNLGNIDFSNMSVRFLLTRVHLVMNKIAIRLQQSGVEA
jgi:hypothetical protein